MVGHHSHGDVLLGVVLVLAVGQFANLANERLEYVSVVVRLLALHSHAEALESHAGVNAFRRQRLEIAVGLAVELHEYEVPYLHNLWVVLVHELLSWSLGSLGFVSQVDVYLGAWPAWSHVAHLPEVVMLVSVYDSVFWQILSPELGSLVVSLESFGLVALEYSGVQSALVELQHFCQVFPCP